MGALQKFGGVDLGYHNMDLPSLGSDQGNPFFFFYCIVNSQLLMRHFYDHSKL